VRAAFVGKEGDGDLAFLQEHLGGALLTAVS
jgi:hypothetical protein